jgi:hypothetical protein
VTFAQFVSERVALRHYRIGFGLDPTGTSARFDNSGHFVLENFQILSHQAAEAKHELRAADSWLI